MTTPENRELPPWAEAIKKRFIAEAMERFYNAPICERTFEGITEMMLRYQFEIATYPLTREELARLALKSERP